MVKKENVQNRLRPRLIVYASLLGLTVAFASMLLMSLAIRKQMLGAGEWGLYSRLCLVLGAAAMGLCICLKAGAKRWIAMLLSAGAMTLLLLCISILISRTQPDASELVISVLTVALVCILLCVFMPSGRKRRKAHRSR